MWCLLPASQPSEAPPTVLPGREPTSGPCNPLFQPTLSYESLRKEAKVLEEEVKAVLEGAQAVSDGAHLFPEGAQVFPEDAQALQEDAQAIQGVALFQVHGQPHCGPWGGRAHLPQPFTQQPVPVATQLPAGSPVPPVAWGSHGPQTPASAVAAPQAGD